MSLATAFAVAAVASAGCSRSAPSPPEADPPSVLLISLDGFRWDYPELADTPNIDELAATGVRADNLIPVFPSKTFPAHYSIVTGLYPGHHGVISNNMRDPDWEEEFRLGTEELTKGRWWGGEPIWTTAGKNGLVTASFFWPGSDVVINGSRPDYFYPYDGGVPFEDRVEQVLAWIDMPAAERPSFITLYFAEPNETAHAFGPEAPETFEQIRRVDDMVGLLVSGLRQRNRLEATDIVLVSDHGMAQMDAARILALDDHVELADEEVFEQGAFLQIFPRPGREALIYEALKDASPHLGVYRRDEIPERFHLAGHRRLGAIIGIPEVGWSVRARRPADGEWGRMLLGDHGGDPAHQDMRGIFIASGPSFRRGARVAPFESIEIYNLLARALGVDPAPNDGVINRVESVLRDPRGGDS